MDRRVKERLIGASILVAIVVLVVPELLSGPKPAAQQALKAQPITPEPFRTVTVDLATSKAPAPGAAEAANSASAASAAGGTAAPPSTAAPSTATPSTAPPGTATQGTAPQGGAGGAAHAAAAGNAAPVETPAPSPISAKQPWTVQLGSFASRANAEKLLLQLKAQGVIVYVSSGGSGQSLRYRVRTEPVTGREAAEKTAAKLKSLGHVSTIVTPGS